ncbi:MAG: efflux RND transporter periplasmic adaptor subunit [Planctomycetales bacterium]|nr:efflux RND transporter periplasmic adaptor subunit [Planctomycetales bacterium]
MTRNGRPPALLPRALADLAWAVLLLGTLGCSHQPPVEVDVVRPVKTLVITQGDGTRTRTFPGTIEAARRVELAFQVPGLLVTFPVREGQQVAKGDLIGQLRQDEFQARLTSLQGELDRARATLAALRAGERREEQLRREAQVRQAEARMANARAELNRSTPLMERRAISRSEFEIVETAYQVAVEDYNVALQLLEKGTVGREEDIMAQEAQVRGLEGRVVEASIQLDDTTLTAPYDGVIAQRFVEEGQNVRAKDPVVRFQDVEEIEIVVDVPETVMTADIRSADIVSLVAEVSGAPGVEFPVEIREIAQVADPTTQTFKVRTAMKAPENIRILPGMTATVTATYRRAEVLGDPTFIPISAVIQDAAGAQAVWIVGPDSVVSRRVVKLGDVSGGGIEVVDGIQAGDRIATAGATHLREGMKVRDLGGALGSQSL